MIRGLGLIITLFVVKARSDGKNTLFRSICKNWEQRLLVSSCISVCLSLRLEQLESHWIDFNEIWCLRIFSIIWRECSKFHEDLTRITVMYMKTYAHFWSHLAHFLLKWEMCQKKDVEKFETHLLCPIVFFKKSYRLWDYVEKYRGGRSQIMAHAIDFHCNNGSKIAPHSYVVSILPVFSMK